MAKTKMLNLFLRTNAGIGVHLKYCECSANRTYSNNCGISLTVWCENASKQREPPTSKRSWDWRGKDIMTLLMIWLETDTAVTQTGLKSKWVDIGIWTGLEVGQPDTYRQSRAESFLRWELALENWRAVCWRARGKWCCLLRGQSACEVQDARHVHLANHSF